MNSLNYVKSKLNILFIFTTLICLVDNIYLKIAILIIFLLFLKRATLFPVAFIIFTMNMSSYISVTETLSNGEDIFVIEEINSNSYIVSLQGSKYSFVTDTKYNYQDVIKINYNAVEINSKMNFNEFDYKKYMNRQGVFQTLYPNSEELISSGFDIRNPVINNVNNIEDEELSSWVKMITLGLKDSDKANTLSALGISHIFAISGFHIGLLFGLFNKIFKNQLLIIIILSTYVYLTGLGVGSIRAWLFILIAYINTRKNLNLTKVDTLAISYIICLVYQPEWVYSVSFYLSFTMTLAILVLSVYKLNFMALSVGLFSFSLPVIMVFSNEINLLAPLVVVIATPLFVMIYPLTILLTFIPSFVIVGDFVKFILNSMITYLDVLYIPISTGVYGVIVSTVIVSLLLIHYSTRTPNVKKFLLSIIVCLNLTKVYEVATIDLEIHMINVGQAECILIRTKSNNILIDVGSENRGGTYEYNIEPYLKNLGINTIDKVFISHDDYDHSGSLEQLVQNFSVGEIYRGNFSSFKYNNLSFEQLNSFNWDNKNDNSQVIEMIHNNKNYLFTGDISDYVEDELELKEEYELLKVAHHGSNSSTGNTFKNININHAIISVGNNNFGHPHQEVIDNLSHTNLHVTRDNGTIIYESNLFHKRVKTLY